MMWLFDSINSIHSIELNRNRIVRGKLHNTFKVNKRRWSSVDSHLVPVVKLCPNYRTLALTITLTLALYLTVLPSLMAAKWPQNISDLLVLLIFFSRWMKMLSSGTIQSKWVENKAKDEDGVDILEFCQHKFSSIKLALMFQFSYQQQHQTCNRAKWEKTRAKHSAVCLRTGLQNSMEFRCLTLCIYRNPLLLLLVLLVLFCFRF